MTRETISAARSAKRDGYKIEPQNPLTNPAENKRCKLHVETKHELVLQS